MKRNVRCEVESCTAKLRYMAHPTRGRPFIPVKNEWRRGNSTSVIIVGSGGSWEDLRKRTRTENGAWKARTPSEPQDRHEEKKQENANQMIGGGGKETVWVPRSPGRPGTPLPRSPVEEVCSKRWETAGAPPAALPPARCNHRGQRRRRLSMDQLSGSVTLDRVLIDK